MSRVFNVSGDCKQGLHYMVDIAERLREIKVLIDKGEYFTINRARQYGKTTTLRALRNYLQEEYMVVSMDFQKIGAASFKDENIFAKTFAVYFVSVIKNLLPKDNEQLKSAVNNLQNTVDKESENFSLFSLFLCLSKICESSDKPIVLMIDEVDSASNNQVFLDFLAQLRGYYIDRDETSTFWSVILAGVYDIKNVRSKIRTEDEHKTNSPWNIAADFDVDMSLSTNGIEGMLAEYEKDYDTGMDIKELSVMIFEYTSGYPFLVSRICKLIDERVAGNTEYPDRSAAWTKQGFLAAVRMLLNEKNTLFESLADKLNAYPELNNMFFILLFTGKNIVYNPDNNVITLANMFGFIKNKDGNVVIANRIFEIRLYNYYLSSVEMQESDIYKASIQDKNQFIFAGHLNMRLILEKFVVHFNDLYPNSDEAFLEEDGRKYFLLYLRPIINGAGNYYIESRTRDMKRTDIIVDYCGEQFIIEMKIWRGDEYNRRGESQLAGYLDEYHQKKGYLLSFNFNQSKQIGVKEILVGDKIIIEAVV